MTIPEKHQNKTIRVTTKATEPFVIKKKLNVDKAAYERMSFEEKYEGFVVDYIRCVENENFFGSYCKMFEVELFSGPWLKR